MKNYIMHLTKNDIKAILKENNLELNENNYDINKNKIPSIKKSKDGILVRCKYLQKDNILLD